jgi:hypothetical protein
MKADSEETIKATHLMISDILAKEFPEDHPT